MSFNALVRLVKNSEFKSGRFVFWGLANVTGRVKRTIRFSDGSTNYPHLHFVWPGDLDKWRTAGEVAGRIDGRLMLKPGDTGSKVIILQDKFVRLGKLSANRVDGAYGQRTEALVKTFQEDEGLEVNGIVDDLTMLKLDEAIQAKG